MHFHLEIIMPPTDKVEAAVAKILSPFDENKEDARNSFWDWHQLGGRYSGSKLEALVTQEKRDAFFAEIKSRKVTVSGVQFGKQELQPAEQIPMVDALWREMCPNAGEVCPFFQHSRNNMNLDICTLAECPESLTAYALIIAALGFQDELEAVHMIHQSVWNGVTHVDTDFSGSVMAELARWRGKAEHYREEYFEKINPRPDWLVVTVDYHS